LIEISQKQPPSQKCGGGILHARKLYIETRRGARCADGGAEGIRTPDPHNAIVVLYQLSYDPIQSGENL
jgi:hypothetical protein